MILNGFIRTQDLTARRYYTMADHIDVTQVNKTITDNTQMDKYKKGLRDNYTRTSSYATGYYK